MTPWPFGGGDDEEAHDTETDEPDGQGERGAEETTASPLGSGADLLASLPGGAFVVADGTITAANERAEAMLAGSGSLTDVRVSRLFPSGLPDPSTAGDAPGVADPLVECDAVTLDGDPVDLLVQVGPRTGVGRTVLCVPAAAAPAPAEHQTFVDGVSHELKQPLSAVSAHLEFLESAVGDDLDADSRRSLAHALDGAERATDLLDDLVTYARVGAGHEERRPVDLSSVLAHVVENVESSLGATLEDEWRVEWDDLPTLSGSPMQFQLLFGNLVSNGLKHQDGPPRTVRVSAESVDGGHRITVSDDGVGIDPAELESIFEPFERGSSASEVGGDGLGLALCRRIVENIGGDIEVKSTPGEGSSFHVFVPDPSTPAESSATGTAADSAASTDDEDGRAPADETVSVVLVDDVEGMRSLLRTVLDRTGRYEVVGEAGDGEAGIETVREVAPNLVLLDLSMPRMDGLEALPEIQSVAPDATVVVYSGFQRDRMEEKVLEHGAAAYLEKGIGPSEIVDEIDEVVGRSPSEAESSSSTGSSSA